MVRIEIDDNLARLREFRLKASQARTFTQAHSISAMQECDALRRNPLPTLDDCFWRRLTALVPTALDAKEIMGVRQLYGRLNELVVLKQRADLPPSDYADAVEKALKQIIENGNPLS